MADILDEQMLKAAQDGNLADLKRLADAGVQIETEGSNNPLLQAACKGHVDCINFLLDRGASIDRQDNSGKWTALLCAAYYGHLDATRVLMERGANRLCLNYQCKNALQLAKDQGKMAVAAFLENNPDQVSYSWPLDNRVMQEVYHFPRRERVTMIRNGVEGPVETMQRESFAALEDQSGLRKAFAEHKKMGGKCTEDEIFSTDMLKTKPRLRTREM